MSLYKNKYRIESARRPGWDYRNPGSYFITICTSKRKHFFGECKDGKMVLSAAGAMVQGFWFEIPKHFKHVRLGEFVVMPNHVHGILILGECDFDVETVHCTVSTSKSSPTEKSQFFKDIGPKAGSVSVIIRSYKSVCTKFIRKSFPDMNFAWQERFHDHIIRNEKSFNRISEYIVNNPTNWKEDKFFRDLG